jgi:hypothetical protein
MEHRLGACPKRKASANGVCPTSALLGGAHIFYAMEHPGATDPPCRSHPYPSAASPPSRPSSALYSDRLYLKALVIMIVKRLDKAHELLGVLEEPTPQMPTVRDPLHEKEDVCPPGAPSREEAQSPAREAARSDRLLLWMEAALGRPRFALGAVFVYQL